MREFWDAKAAENAHYYISSYRDYDDQDPEQFWAWGEKLIDRFLSESGIAFRGDESVLEIGCGIGRMTAPLSRRFGRVVAVDVSPAMIEQARANLSERENVELHAGNGSDLGFCGDASVDLVFSYITLQHIPDVEIVMNYIREAGRVLKTGGHFYFQVNHMPKTLRERLRLRSRLRALLRALGGGKGGSSRESAGGPRGLDHPAWQGSRISLGQLRTACAQGGLEVLTLRGEGTQYLWVKARKRG